MFAPLNKNPFLDQWLLLSEPAAAAAAASQALWKSGWKKDVPAQGGGLDQTVFEKSLPTHPILYGSTNHIAASEDDTTDSKSRKSGVPNLM